MKFLTGRASVDQPGDTRSQASGDENSHDVIPAAAPWRAFIFALSNRRSHFFRKFESEQSAERSRERRQLSNPHRSHHYAPSPTFCPRQISQPLQLKHRTRL